MTAPVKLPSRCELFSVEIAAPDFDCENDRSKYIRNHLEGSDYFVRQFPKTHV